MASSQDHLRGLIEANGAVFGAWCVLPSPEIAMRAAEAGYDFVVVDMQHGLISDTYLPEMVRAIDAGGAIALVRVARSEAFEIGQALDAGAAGIIAPLIDTVDDAKAVIEAALYPPDGRRSFGPTRARWMVGDKSAYIRVANSNVAILPMIETDMGMENVDEIAALEGVTGLFVGPADLSLSMGLAPGQDNSDPRFKSALERVTETCRLRGLIAGIQANPEILSERVEQGFRCITDVIDLSSIKQVFKANVVQRGSH